MLAVLAIVATCGGSRMIDDGHDPDTIQFLDEDTCISPGDADPGWLIAVIDDEPAVFEATRLALDVMRFDGRPIKLLHATSGEAGKKLLMTTPDIACILLDVVMETDQAGLDLVREIR